MMVTVLEDAYRLVDGGWCRRTPRRLVNGDPHQCLLTALHTAARRADVSFFHVANSVRQQLPLGYRFAPIWAWNDSQKDKRPVLRLIRAAIDAEKEKVVA